MLLEIVIAAPHYLAFEHGGWLAVAWLCIPVAIGITVCIGEIREDRVNRIKWANVELSASRRDEEYYQDEQFAGLLDVQSR
jgi:hypothetical protein